MAALLVVYLAMNSDWRTWLISGPGVLGHLGGGPFQLVMYVGGLLATIVLLVAGGSMVRHAIRMNSPG